MKSVAAVRSTAILDIHLRRTDRRCDSNLWATLPRLESHRTDR